VACHDEVRLLEKTRTLDYEDMATSDTHPAAATAQDDLYAQAVAAHGRMIDRLATGYEADPDKRRDLRQEIHLQLWRSCAVFDGRCTLKTWTLRVAHNTAASYVIRERRRNAELVSLEDMEQTPPSAAATETNHGTALHDVRQLLLQLKPLDRQILLCYLEEMDAASIAEVTGLSPRNVAMKIHRTKKLLAARIRKERTHA